jgi:hypothetical protein
MSLWMRTCFSHAVSCRGWTGGSSFVTSSRAVPPPSPTRTGTGASGLVHDDLRRWTGLPDDWEGWKEPPAPILLEERRKRGICDEIRKGSVRRLLVPESEGAPARESVALHAGAGWWSIPNRCLSTGPDPSRLRAGSRSGARLHGRARRHRSSEHEPVQMLAPPRAHRGVAERTRDDGLVQPLATSGHVAQIEEGVLVSALPE